MGCVHRLGQSQRGGDFAVVGGYVAGPNSDSHADPDTDSQSAAQEAQAQEAVSHWRVARTTGHGFVHCARVTRH